LPNSITQVQPPLEFIPPAFNPWVYQATRLLLPGWMRWRAGIVEAEVSHSEILVDLYRQFQLGKTRFMMAFRHPSTNDPVTMNYLLSHHVPRAAQQQGVPLQFPTYAHFIYDRGIPLWAGKGVGWYYAHMGCTPIRRGKVDRAGLRSARQLFAEGQFPMAAAPEGATNGQNGILSPIEPGIAQFGFWCAEDLAKAGRPEQVCILPIGIQYHYIDAPWEAMEKLLTQLEVESGLKVCDDSTLLIDVQERGLLIQSDKLTDPRSIALYHRILRLSYHLLERMEQFYSKFYHQNLKSPAATETQIMPDSAFATNQQLATRLQALLNSALTVAEQYFAVQPNGSLTDRCRRLEQAGWDWIYREDLSSLDELPEVERRLADRVAEEANLNLWHMRLAETFVSVTGRYVIEQPSCERFAETLLLLWDVVTRLKGEFPFPRPQLGSQRVKVTIGEPLSVSDRWSDYQSSRRQAITACTTDLQTALEQMIE
jgi:1-acyl-sn-glycerol-3-phosphate acyltransferase